MTVEHGPERASPPERIQLADFSRALSLKFARGDLSLEKPDTLKQGEQVAEEVSGSVLTVFTHKQETERKSHWQGKGVSSYAQQMEQWLHGENNSGGVAEWLEAAMQDPDLLPFFESNNLHIFTRLEGDLGPRKERVQPVIDAINKSGGAMNFEELANDPSRHIDISALQLYATYLTRGEEGIRNLIDVLVNVAKEGATYEEARAKLQKMIPLMNMFGENAHKTFAAITDAQLRLDYPDERQTLGGLPEDQLDLTPSDIQVLTYLREGGSVSADQGSTHSTLNLPPILPDTSPDDDEDKRETGHQPGPLLVPPLEKDSEE